MPSLEFILEAVGGEPRVHFGLETLKGALAEIWHPERVCLPILVGGTNGKGSTTLFISQALVDAGFRVGTFLSPHLQHPRERILSQLVAISEVELSELANEYFGVAQRFNLTYFEFFTLLCLARGAARREDFLVLEVGLGGRLDATNVVDPIASVITNISLDHQEFLGNTTPMILGEKLGIVRPEGLVFSSIEEPDLVAQMDQHCLLVDAIPYYTKELRITEVIRSWDGQSFKINGHPVSISNPLAGMERNAATAWLMLRILFPKISLETIHAAFAKVINPGRFEVISESPRVILSGDHNPAGVAALTETLVALGSPKLVVVCGYSPTKPFTEMFRNLSGLAERVYLTEVERFQGQMPDSYHLMAKVIAPAEQAIAEALVELKQDETLLVTGSLYLVGQVRKLWRSEVSFLRAEPKTDLKWDESKWATARPKAPEQNLFH